MLVFSSYMKYQHTHQKAERPYSELYLSNTTLCFPQHHWLWTPGSGKYFGNVEA